MLNESDSTEASGLFGWGGGVGWSLGLGVQGLGFRDSRFHVFSHEGAETLGSITVRGLMRPLYPNPLHPKPQTPNPDPHDPKTLNPNPLNPKPLNPEP